MSTTGKLKHQTARGKRGGGQRGGVSVVVKVGSSETLYRSGISTGEAEGLVGECGKRPAALFSTCFVAPN